jgi:hypothetical protein
LLTIALSSSAHAGPSTTKVWVSGTTLKIRDASTGGPSESDFKNCMVVKLKRDEGRAYIADCFGSVIAGPGCTAGSISENVSAGNPEDLWLPNEEAYGAVCQTAGVKKVDINSGPGDDVVTVLLSHVPIKIVGGEGNDNLQYESLMPNGMAIPYFSTANIIGGLGDDYLIGGRGDDRISGGSGNDWIDGACGSDRLSGGTTADSFVTQESLWGDDDCPPSVDVVNCGDGSGTVLADPTDILLRCN